MKTKSKPVTKLEKLISEQIGIIGKAGKFDHVAVVTLNLLKTKVKVSLHGSKNYVIC